MTSFCNRSDSAAPPPTRSSVSLNLPNSVLTALRISQTSPLRFSIGDPDRQARYAAVFAITAGAFVPLNFLAVRLAESLVHLRVLSATGGSLPGSMRFTFLVSLAAIATVYVTLCKLELTSKHVAEQLRRLRSAMEAPPAGGAGAHPAPVARVPARPTLEP